MKKLIILLSILFVLCYKGSGQAKPDTTKPKYNYFVQVPAADYQQLAQALNEYKRLCMYDPQASGDQKVRIFQGIEAYLKELPTRLKLDSVKVQTKGKP